MEAGGPPGGGGGRVRARAQAVRDHPPVSQRGRGRRLHAT